MSSTLRATTSQPRNLLSMARLNNARSRVRCSIWSLVRIAQTCFCRSGGLAPVSFPLFQGAAGGPVARNWHHLAWLHSSVTEEGQLALVRPEGRNLVAYWGNNGQRSVRRLNRYAAIDPTRSK